MADQESPRHAGPGESRYEMSEKRDTRACDSARVARKTYRAISFFSPVRMRYTAEIG